MLSPVAKKHKKSEAQTLIFNYLAVTLPARWRLAAAHNQARRLTAGPAAGTTVYIIACYWGTAAAQYAARRLSEDPDELWGLVRTSACPGPAG